MKRDDNIAKLISQNPVNKGLDYSYVNKLIREITFQHFPEFKEINGIQHVHHKRRVGKRNSTFIYSYYVRGKDANGASLMRHLIYSSHSDGSRLKAYKALTMLIENGFN